MWIAAVRAPKAPGVKVTVNVVLPPPTTVVLTGPETVKSAELVPSLVMDRPVRSSEPLFLMVKVLTGVVVATSASGKLMLAVPSTRLVNNGCSTAISGPVLNDRMAPVFVPFTFVPDAR